MNLKFTAQPLIVSLFLIALLLSGCGPATADSVATLQTSPVAGEIPTWTPRPEDLTALPTATKSAPVTPTTAVTLTLVGATPIVPTPKTVSVAIKGGNLFVHRGPSLYHNFIGVLYDGDVVFATGRDRISRWIRVEIPSKPGVDGWITTETEYTQISGDLANLPFIETEPAVPAYIRNCTKSTLWIFPDDVQLLDKFNAPYNEEQFIVGKHQVVDPNSPNVSLEDVDLSEGETVDIRYNAAGEKSKCE